MKFGTKVQIISYQLQTRPKPGFSKKSGISVFSLQVNNHDALMKRKLLSKLEFYCVYAEK